MGPIIGGAISVDVDVDASVDLSASVSVGFGGVVGIAAGTAIPMGGRRDPFCCYNFSVEIEGVVTAGFNEVSGLSLEIEVQDYREGGMNEFIHKRAGPAKYPSNLILKRGMTTVTELWNWYWDVTQGTVMRKNISVVLMNSSGEEERRWNFEQAYPVKWTGPDLRATANEVAFESLEFAHKGLAHR